MSRREQQKKSLQPPSVSPFSDSEASHTRSSILLVLVTGGRRGPSNSSSVKAKATSPRMPVPWQSSVPALHLTVQGKEPAPLMSQIFLEWGKNRQGCQYKQALGME